MKGSLLFIFCAFTFSEFVFSQIPQTMSYQGVLTNSDGSAVADGSYSLTFKLYDASANGDSLWQEVQNVQVTKGLFNTILGSVTPLNLTFDKQYWLGISIGNGTELTPRTALTASPYSLNSHSTITEPLPGQGLTIRNSSGEATHQFDVNGDVTHNGVGKFFGGIIVGDSLVTPDDTTGVIQKSLQLQRQSINKTIEALENVGIIAGGIEVGALGYGSRVGVQGQSDQGLGLYGTSKSNWGVFGNSVSGGGVRGKSVSGTGLWGLSENGNGVVGQSTNSAGVFGQSETEDGVTGLSINGNGVFGGSGTGAGIVGFGEFGGWFQGKVKIDVIPAALNQERFLVWDDDNVVKYRTLPSVGSFDGILQDKALIVKSGTTEVFRVNTDGTSYHKGVETFDDDVIFKGTDGKGAKLVDGAGNTIAGFGRKDLQTGQRFGVYGKAETSGDLAGVFDGDVEVNGEIVTESLHIVAGGTDTLISFNSDGTSYHKGKETYIGGIDLPDLNTENTTGNVKAGKFNQGSSQFSSIKSNNISNELNPPSLLGGTMSFNPATDYEPVIWGYTERPTGASVFGQNTNTSNTYPANWGVNFGGGGGVVGEVRNSSSNYPGMWAITYGTGTAFLIDHQGSAGNIFIGRSGGLNQARIDKTGKAFFNGGTQTGGADLAEAFEVEGLADEYEPGDVMVISLKSDRTMTKSYNPYSTLVAGVYASKPGVLLTERNIDDSHEDTVPLGVVGVIPTKISDENGPIFRGDLLVSSSTPGHAMKGTDKERMLGAVLGKALENFNSGTGVIKVLVNTK